MYSRRAYHLRRVVATAALLVILFNHADDLLRFLERALSASPRQQAMWIISLTAYGLLGRIIWSGVAAVIGNPGAPPVYTATPALGYARQARLAAIAKGDLERWAEIRKHEGESVKEAVERLKPVWNQRDLSEDVSITQRRRHEAAHAVIAHALGGTVMAADIHQKGDAGGSVEALPPIPSISPEHTMWTRLQIAVAGAAQDVTDGNLNYGSSSDINKALYQATMLTAAGWTPEGYTGPLNPNSLMAYAIETDKQLLAQRQDATTAIEKALTDKDKLTGIEVHHILDTLHPKPAAEVAG